MIRTATKFDIPYIVEMLRHYRDVTPWDILKECDNEEYIVKLLTQIFAGMGVIFLAEKDNKIIGMLIAAKTPNIWDPNLYIMNELAYWVEPEHRGSTAGYRLIKQYTKYCDEMKQHNKIKGYTISKMSNSPDLDYSKFGFNKLEEMWRQ